MTPPGTKQWRSPLARRLVIAVVMFSSVITLVLTVFQLYRNYRGDLGLINDELAQIERVHVPSIVNALWATDVAAVQLQLDGMLRTRDMHYLEVRENDTVNDTVAVSAGTLKSRNVIVREFPLSYTHRGQILQIGTLKAVATLDGVYRRLLDTAIVILLSNAIKTFLVAGFMLVLFHLLVGRHLARVSDYAQRLGLYGLDEPINLDRHRRGTGAPDEIDRLTQALDEMRDNLRRSRDVLKASEQQLHNLFEQAHDCILVIDPNSGRILDTNSQATVLTGFERDELLGMTVMGLSPPAARKESEAALRKLQQMGEAIFERILQHKNGHPVPVEVSSRLIDFGERKVLVSFVRDLSERRRAETEILRLARILDRSTDAIFVIDKDTLRYKWVNQVAQRQTGYSAEELFAMTPADLISGLTPETVRERLLPVLSGETPMIAREGMMKRRDGSRFPVEARLFLSHAEDPPAIVAISLDITERKLAEARLTESHNLLNAVVSGATDAIFVKDREGRYLFVNESCAKILDRPMSDVIGRDDTDIFPAAMVPEIKARDREIMAGSGPVTFEEAVPAAAGEHIFLTTKLPFLDAAGQVTGLIGVSRDITALKRTERALQESEAKYRALVEHSPAVTYIADTDENIGTLYISPQIEAILGYTTARWLEQADFFLSIIHPDDRARVVKLVEEVRDSPELRPMVDIDYRVYDRDGNIHWFRDRAIPTLDHTGSHRVFRGMILDITALKQAEAETARLGRILDESANEIYVFHTDDLRFVGANEGALRNLGYSRDELLRMTPLDLKPEYTRESFEQLLAPLRRSERQLISFETYHRRKDRSTYPVEVRLHLSRREEPALFAAVILDISERIRAEQALRAERDFNSAVLETVGAIVVVLDRRGRIARFNRACEQLTGYRVDEVQGRYVWDFLLPPEQVDAVRTVFAALTADGLASRYQNEWLTRAGERRLIDWSNTTLSDATGTVEYVIATGIDITERRRAEETLRERDKILQLFVEHSPAAIAMLDREMRYVAVSRRWKSDFQLGERELIGRGHYEIFPEIPQRWKDAHRRCLAGATERNDHDSFVRADGHVDWVQWEICPWRQANSEIGGIIIFTELVTDRKRTEEALRDSHERFRQALRAARSGAWEWNIATNGVIWSEENYAVLGLQPDIGPPTYDTWLNCVHPDDRERSVRAIEQALEERTDLNLECRIVRPDGEVRWISDVGRLVFDETGKPVMMYGIQIDITERKQAELERESLLTELTARNTEMENFVYTISHDLKSPLITIGGFAGLLQRDLERGDAATASDSLMEIGTAVADMQKLIDDLLTLSRTGRVVGEPEPVALGALVAEVADRFKERIATARARVTPAPELPVICADRARMAQVFQNLVDNALKYARDGIDPVIEIGSERRDGELRIFVRDNGRGIKKEYHERIFGLFQRVDTRTEGTGVGLAITRRIIEVHGGRMWVESEPGRGSTFWISFPDSVSLDRGDPPRMEGKI